MADEPEGTASGTPRIEPAGAAPSSRPAGALINRVIGGRYEILEMIGEGPLLAAFRARDRSLNRVVTVKTLLPSRTGADQSDTVRKLREGLGEVLSLNHPNVTRAYDVGADEENGLPVFLVEEYVRGIDLKERIRRAAPFQLTAATDALISLASALEFAHGRGIAHGDVRPQNVLIGPEGQVKLSNFGVAEAQNGALYQDPGLLGRVVSYVAPDAAGAAKPTASGDLYSLGVILYEMLTGDLPYKGDNPVQVALKHAQEPIPSPRHVNTGVPRALEGIVIKALGKRPEDRYLSASEMLADLREVRDALRYGKSLAWSPLDRTRRTAAAAAATASVPSIEIDPEPASPPRTVVPRAVAAATAAAAASGAAGEADGTIVMPGNLRGAASVEARSAGSPAAYGGSGAGRSVSSSGMSRMPLPGDEDDYDDRRGGGGRRRGGWNWITFINLFLMLLIAGAVFGGIYWTYTNVLQVQGETVVPNLVGKTMTSAKTLAAEQKFELAIVDQQFNDRIPADTIYQQKPAPGYHIREGKQVSIWVSRGPHMADVPDVRDMAYDRAKRVVEAAGLRVGKNTYEYDPIGARGNVLRQTPEPGESRPRGTKVDLVLSKGEEPPPTPEPLPSPIVDDSPTSGGAGTGTPPGDVPTTDDQQQRTFAVGYKVPSDGQPHHIRIDVIDADGPHTAYDQSNQAGEKVQTEVSGTGKQITIKLYDNDALRSEQTR